MASAVIHMCVAHEINKVLNKNYDKLIIGSIAPDISKHLGRTKFESHFLDSTIDDIPNLNRFLKKYKTYLNDDFVLGYYIHLYTDYIWVNVFLKEVLSDNLIHTIDGKDVKYDAKLFHDYIYNDYTNLNVKLLDEYDMDLHIFYSDIPQFKDIIKEIPMDKINIIVEKMGLIIENTKEKKSYVFDVDIIKKFIKLSTDIILTNIKEMNLE